MKNKPKLEGTAAEMRIRVDLEDDDVSKMKLKDVLTRRHNMN